MGFSKPHDARGPHPAGCLRRKDRAPYAAGSGGEEVAQIGEPPAPRRVGSLVESPGKLDSKGRFPEAVQLVKASHGGGGQPPEQAGVTRE